MTARLRVVLPEAHAEVRPAHEARLDSEAPLAVVEDIQDTSALRAALELHPDVFIMDVSVSGIRGTEATERIRRAGPGVRIIALTDYEEVADARGILEARVRGYVLKQAAAQDFVTAIRAVDAGETHLDPNLTGSGIAPLESARERAGDALSTRESEVLRLIAQGHTIKEIATRLELSPRTLETYKARAMEKLGIRSRADIVSYAVRRGWLKDV